MNFNFIITSKCVFVWKMFCFPFCQNKDGLLLVNTDETKHVSPTLEGAEEVQKL